MTSFVLKRPKYLVGNKPFSRLPLKERAIFVLHMAGFTCRDIEKVLSGTSRSAISRWIVNGYGEYTD